LEIRREEAKKEARAKGPEGRPEGSESREGSKRKEVSKMKETKKELVKKEVVHRDMCKGVYPN